MINQNIPATLPDKAPDFDLRELLEAGVHFGHQSQKWHPKMAEYIYMAKDGIHIFDLAKTAEQLTKAYNYAYYLGSQGMSLVMVGTKRQARELIKEAAIDAGAMYVVSRWLGGTITNWQQVSKSRKHMVSLEKGLEKGDFKGYTKYERVQMEKEMVRLQRFFEGIRDLNGLPDALFVVDPTREQNAIKEANLTDIPVMALADTNADPSQLDIVVPGNDDAMGSVKLIVETIAAGYKAGRQDKGKAPKKAESTNEKSESKTTTKAAKAA